MTDALALALAVLALGACLVTAAQAGVGGFRWSRTAPTLALLQIGLLVQAALHVVGLVRGHQPQETGTHLAYLVVSVVLLPAAAAQTRGDDGRWSGILLAVVLLVTVVLIIRLQTTWRMSHV